MKINTQNRKLKLAILTTCFASSANAAIVINEFDYDRPGTDNAEFIELFNSGANSALDNFSIQLINGNSGTKYRTIDLAGFNIAANNYFVVCGNTSLVANCDYSFTTTDGWFQNGAPDALALFENENIIDSVSYEGLLSTFTEGDVLDITDNNATPLSIARLMDGIDSNNNLHDFQASCLSPGSANSAGISQFSSEGSCTFAAPSAVPVPAAMWLFGSGLIGLAGVARKKNKA